MTVQELWDGIQGISSVLVLLGAPFFGWVLWSLNQKFVPSATCEQKRNLVIEQVENVEEENNDIEQRLALLEQALKNLPKAEDVHAIRETQAEQGAVLRGMRESFVRLEKQYDTLDHFLRENAK